MAGPIGTRRDDKGVQRQDRARHSRLRTRLGSVCGADGARGCAQRALPGLGRHRHRHVGLLRRSGRDARDEPARRTRCAAVAVPHHRAVLADPGVTADRSQRDHRRHGDHRGVHRRVPELQRPHPRGHGSAVGGARRARLQHLLRRQVAPHPAGGVEPRCHQTALATGARLRAVLRIPGRRDRPVVSRTRLRQPPRRRRPPPPRTATTCRKTWRTRPSSSSGTPRSSRPTSRGSPTCAPGAGHAPHHVFKEWADRYAGRFDMGYESYREIVLENQKRLGIVPAGHRIVAGEPVSRRQGTQRGGVAVRRTPCGRGTRSTTRRSACSPEWRRSSPGSCPTPTPRSAGSSTTSRSPVSSTTPSSW